MATFERREGTWRVKVRKSGVSRSATFRTKAEAVSWSIKVEAEIQAMKSGLIPNKSFGDVLQRYSREISPLKRGCRWERLRIDLFLREYPKLCLTKLQFLGPDVFATWRDERLKSVSALSVRREWAILQHACNVAVKEWRWLPLNPMSTVKAPAGGGCTYASADFARDRASTAGLWLWPQCAAGVCLGPGGGCLAFCH